MNVGTINTAGTTTLYTAIGKTSLTMRLVNKLSVDVTVQVVVAGKQWFTDLTIPAAGGNTNYYEDDVVLADTDTVQVVSTGTPDIDWFIIGEFAE